jgi:uncharacterized protein with ParB-like and HNH nuclease domain
MDKSIKAKSVSFFEFEKEFTRQYFVPTLQRPYVWEAKKHVKKFLDDIEENSKNYFIGSIVVVGSKDGTTGREEIIDGQQRLTTISLLLISIRDLIRENKLENQCEIILREIDSFLKYIDSFDHQEIIRLKFSDNNTDFFFKNMINAEKEVTPSTETQTRMIENYKYISSYFFEKFTVNGKFNKSNIVEYFEKIKSLQAIGITCRDHTIAYELFESINATGLSLASVDLIKNFVFKKVKDNQKLLVSIEKDWGELESIFSEDRSLLKTFLRHQWISRGEYVSHAALFKGVEDKFKDGGEKITQYIEVILCDAKLYYALRKHNIEDLSKVNKLKGFEQKNLKEVLRFLHFLGVDQVYAPILYFYVNKNANQFIKYTNKLVAFQFLYKYIPGSPSAAERIFANMTKDRDNENFHKLIELVDKSKENFREKFIEKSIYRGGKSGDLQFALERYVYSKGGPKAFKEPTIEHIINQNRDDKNLHKIGNLTIFERDVNSSLPEKFQEKISHYRNSAYLEHQEIIDNYNFTNNHLVAIEKRSNDIAGDVYDIFMKILKTGKL